MWSSLCVCVLISSSYKGTWSQTHPNDLILINSLKTFSGSAGLVGPGVVQYWRRVTDYATAGLDDLSSWAAAGRKSVVINWLRGPDQLADMYFSSG